MSLNTQHQSNSLMTRKGPGRFARGVCAAGLIVAMGAVADPITVPNGDFTDPANAGSVGGGVIGGSQANAPIGSGPWLGTYWGLAGLLAPPTLTIDANAERASISGLAAVNVLGLLNNGGYFTQSLPESYAFGRFYIISADVDVGGLLSLDLLSDAGVSIGLRSGGNVLASSDASPPHLVDLDLLDGTSQRLRMGYLADATAVGPINIKMGYEPAGVATVDLLSSVSFRNVGLEVRDIGPAIAVEILTFGDMLQAEVGQPFSGSLVALVRDEDGDGVPGHVVTFEGPDSGAGAVLSSPTGGTGTKVTAVTDIDGIAVVNAVANEEAGCFRVTIEGENLPEISTFHLRNYSNDPGVDSVFCNGYQ